MDHPCEKCGALVEDGRAFCPQCRAPQIHVQVAEANEPTEAGVRADAELSIAISPTAGSYAVTVARSGSFNRETAVRCALKAGGLGVLIGIIVTIPLIGLLLAGTLAVLFYRRESKSSSDAWTGLKLGALAGAVWLGIDYLIEIVAVFATHSQQEVIEKLVKTWQAMGVDPNTPGIQTAIRIMFTPGGILLGLIFGAIFAGLLAGFTGAVTAAVMGHRNRR